MIFAKKFIFQLFTFSDFSISHLLLSRYHLGVSNETFVALIASFFLGLVPLGRLQKFGDEYKAILILKSTAVLVVYGLSVLKLSSAGYSPFIYANF